MGRFEDLRDTPVVDLLGKQRETPAQLKARQNQERKQGTAKRAKKGKRKRKIAESQNRAAEKAVALRDAPKVDATPESFAGDIGSGARDILGLLPHLTPAGAGMKAARKLGLGKPDPASVPDITSAADRRAAGKARRMIRDDVVEKPLRGGPFGRESWSGTSDYSGGGSVLARGQGRAQRGVRPTKIR